MCSAAHGLVGLGRIVFVSSAQQLTTWLADFGNHKLSLRALSINEVVPGVVVDGPVPSLVEQVHELHRRFHKR